MAYRRACMAYDELPGVTIRDSYGSTASFGVFNFFRADFS